MWCWRRLLRVTWTASKSNQSVLKEINPEYSLEGLMMKLQYLATWSEEPALWKRLWCWERLRASGEEGNRGWDGWMASLTPWTRVWENSRRQWRTGKPGVLPFMGSQRVRHDLATAQQQLCAVEQLHEVSVHFENVTTQLWVLFVQKQFCLCSPVLVIPLDSCFPHGCMWLCSDMDSNLTLLSNVYFFTLDTRNL